MEESKTEYDRLVEEASKLTKKADIRENKKDQALMESQYNNAKTRTEELEAKYNDMME